MDNQMFRITNTTVKPVRRDSNGKDLRTAIERVGHPVALDGKSSRKDILMPNRSIISSQIDEGTLKLQRQGYIRIEQIKDVTQALREHTLERDQTKTAAHKKAAENREENRKAKAVEMGLDTHQGKSGKEYDGAVNPDGDPNFVAVAGKKSKPRKRRRGEEETSSEGLL